MLSKYLKYSSKYIAFLRLFCLEGWERHILQNVNNCSRTYIYGIVNILKMDIHL